MRSVVVGTAAVLMVSYAVPWFFGGQILSLVFGPAYVGGAPALRLLWLTTSLLILQALCVFALLGSDRTRGAWLCTLPCLLMSGLLWRFHETPTEIASCSLASVAAGTLPVGTMLVLARKR